MAGLNGNARFPISFAVQTMRMTWTFFSVFGQFQIQRIWVDIGCNTTGNSMIHISTPSKEFTWFAAGLPDLRGRRRRRGLRYTRLGKKFRSESAASRSRDTNRAFEVTQQYWGTFIAKPVPVLDIIERWKGDAVLLRCVMSLRLLTTNCSLSIAYRLKWQLYFCQSVSAFDGDCTIPFRSCRTDSGRNRLH